MSLPDVTSSKCTIIHPQQFENQLFKLLYKQRFFLVCFRVFFVPHFVIPFPNHTAYITLNATQTPMYIHRFGCAIMKKYRHENYNSSSAHLRLACKWVNSNRLPWSVFTSICNVCVFWRQIIRPAVRNRAPWDLCPIFRSESEVLGSSSTFTVYGCSMLTNFAVIVSVL